MVKFKIIGSMVTGGKAYVFVSRLGSVEFTLPTEPKLNGVPIERWVDQPRTVDPQDFNAFVFALKDPITKARFNNGDEVELS